MYKQSNKNKQTTYKNGNDNLSSDEILDKNLYSRQIYALGISAMQNLRLANVLISGLNSIGVEISKNLILGGVRNVTIHDTKNITWNDLSAQVSFFLYKLNFLIDTNF